MYYLNNKMPETYKQKSEQGITSTQVITVKELEGCNASTLKRAREKVQEVIRRRKGIDLVTIKEGQEQ